MVPFDSHSGWGRQINDDGNIYDIATATGGAYNEWVMQHTSSIDQRGSGAVGPTSPTIDKARSTSSGALT